LYGCEISPLALREEQRLRVLENRVPRKIFGPKEDRVTEEWRRLHNEELHDLYSSPSTIRAINPRKIIWAGQVERMLDRRGVHRVLVRKPKERRPLGRPTRR
jgi:hypothetical protein